MKSKSMTSNTFIGIEDLSISCCIGIDPHELLVSQKIIISILAEVCIDNSLESDEINDTIDYCLLAKISQDLAASRKYCLIEKYASDLANAVLNIDKVLSVTVTVKKPMALDGIGCPLVKISRKYGDI